MSRRFFTADFHLGMASIIEFEGRPFSDVGEMNAAFAAQCETRAKKGDIIIHAGDLACFKSDSHAGQCAGLSVKPDEMLKNVKADFINIRGNHDVNNKVRSACESMTVRLGQKYLNVVVGHYPSYDPRASEYIRDGWICICGHVHGKWRHCLDMNRKVLNVNVGVDAWGYKLVAEDDLCRYIGKVLTHRPDELYRCFMSKGKLRFQGKKEIL